jgi:hypothetical protein
MAVDYVHPNYSYRPEGFDSSNPIDYRVGTERKTAADTVKSLVLPFDRGLGTMHQRQELEFYLSHFVNGLASRPITDREVFYRDTIVSADRHDPVRAMQDLLMIS